MQDAAPHTPPPLTPPPLTPKEQSRVQRQLGQALTHLRNARILLFVIAGLQLSAAWVLWDGILGEGPLGQALRLATIVLGSVGGAALLAALWILVAPFACTLLLALLNSALAAFMVYAAPEVIWPWVQIALALLLWGNVVLARPAGRLLRQHPDLLAARRARGETPPAMPGEVSTRHEARRARKRDLHALPLFVSLVALFAGLAFVLFLTAPKGPGEAVASFEQGWRHSDPERILATGTEKARSQGWRLLRHTARKHFWDAAYPPLGPKEEIELGEGLHRLRYELDGGWLTVTWSLRMPDGESNERWMLTGLKFEL